MPPSTTRAERSCACGTRQSHGKPTTWRPGCAGGRRGHLLATGSAFAMSLRGDHRRAPEFGLGFEATQHEFGDVAGRDAAPWAESQGAGSVFPEALARNHARRAHECPVAIAVDDGRGETFGVVEVDAWCQFEQRDNELLSEVARIAW